LVSRKQNQGEFCFFPYFSVTLAMRFPPSCSATLLLFIWPNGPIFLIGR